MLLILTFYKHELCGWSRTRHWDTNYMLGIRWV